MKTLVLGLGNPILSDDGVGFRVIEALRDRLDPGQATVMETGVGGLGLLDLLTGYDRAIIVDAMQTAGGEPGKVCRLEPGVLESTRHAASPHDVNFATALELGHRLGMALPREIVIFGIEVADATTFGEECTPKVRQAIPLCVEMVLRELNGGVHA
ncbi:MAG: hydrogenase maturation protease [Chloroflexota bacterium]